MPTFSIYSIGDSAFLEQILIGIAMITGTADMGRLVSIGLLVSAFFVCVKAVLQGGKNIEFQQVLVCWIVYACMFGPSCRVVIEDVYTGGVRVVDNVPIGVGGVGGIISTVGFGITQLFETGYGVINSGLTENRYADPLKILNSARRNIGQSNVFAALDQDLGGGFIDTRRTLENYMKECSLVKMDIEGDDRTSVSTFMNQPTVESLEFTSSIYTTKIFLSPRNSGGQTLTCTEAWPLVQSQVLGVIGHIDGGASNTTQAMYKALGIKPPSADNPNARPPLESIGNALNTVGINQTQAQDFILSALIEPVYYAAAEQKYIDFHDNNSALAINQALMQRDTQWAAESSMFLTIVRPMMTFFEAFSYAITPFMAFIIVLGQMGMSLAAKYLQLQLWIQLWFPILSVTNLYINMAATSAMSSYSFEKGKSLYALNDIGNITQHWVGVGGMLMAATPIISMVLVTGSAVAMTSLAGRMSSTDHLDEKTVSPDATKTGALVNTQAQNTNDSFQGMYQTGSQSAVPDIQVGQGLSEQASNARQVASSKTQSWGNNVSQAFSEGANTAQGFQALQQVGNSLAAAGGTGSATVDSQVKSLTQGLGLSSNTVNAISAAATANGGISVPMLGGIKGQVDSSESAAMSQVMERAEKMQGSFSVSSDDKAAMTNQLMTSATSTGSTGFTHLVGEQRAETLTNEAKEALSATETASSLTSASSNVGLSTSVKATTLGAAIVNNDQARAASQAAYQQSAPGGAFRKSVEDKQSFYESMNIEPEQARHAAVVASLFDSNAADSDKEKMSNAQMGAAIFQSATGMASNPHSGAGASLYAGADGKAGPDDSKFNKPVAQAPTNKNSFDGTIASANTAANVDNLQPLASEGAVREQHQANADRVSGIADKGVQAGIEAQKESLVGMMKSQTLSTGLKNMADTGKSVAGIKAMTSSTGSWSDSFEQTQKPIIQDNLDKNPVSAGLTEGQKAFFVGIASANQSGYGGYASSGEKALRAEFDDTPEGNKQFEAVSNDLFVAAMHSSGKGSEAGSQGLARVAEFNRLNQMSNDENRHMTAKAAGPSPALDPNYSYPAGHPYSDVPK